MQWLLNIGQDAAVTLLAGAGAGGAPPRRMRPNYAQTAELERLMVENAQLKRELEKKDPETVAKKTAQKREAPEQKQTVYEATRARIGNSERAKDPAFKREYVKRFNALVKKKFG